jgi:ABC-type glycerol-3-phosphate transport system substrate-binding protein
VLLANHTGYYALLGKEFEQRTGAKVTFTREQFGAIPTKLTPAFQSGGPSWDLVYIWRAWIEQYRDFLTPLDELGAAPTRAQERAFLPVAVEAGKSLNGRWYGLPSNVYTYVLYGNRRRLREEGVDELPTNYRDFVALAKELTRRGRYGYTDGWAPLYLMPKWAVWLHLNGGRLYSRGQVGEVRFDTPQAMQATQDMIDLLPAMPKQAVTSPWGIYDVEAKKVFFSGRAAMIIDYPHIWYESADRKVSKIRPQDRLVGLVPGKSGRGRPKSGGQFVGESFGIPKSSPNKEAALELARFFTNARAQLGLLTRRRDMLRFEPTDEDGYPSLKASYNSRRVPAGDRTVIRTVFEQQGYPGQRYGTRPAYQQISDTIEAAVSAALNKQVDVERAHRDAQQKLDRIVDEEKL